MCGSQRRGEIRDAESSSFLVDCTRQNISEKYKTYESSRGDSTTLAIEMLAALKIRNLSMTNDDDLDDSLMLFRCSI